MNGIVSTDAETWHLRDFGPNPLLRGKAWIFLFFVSDRMAWIQRAGLWTYVLGARPGLQELEIIEERGARVGTMEERDGRT